MRMETRYTNDVDFFKSFGMEEDGLLKSKEMPIGTVSKGMKKIAKGKWVPEKGKKQTEKQVEKLN